MAAVSGAVCKVKIAFGEDIYKVTVSEYKELMDYIFSNVLKETVGVNFKLRYADSDGDVIVIKYEKDFQEAVQEYAGSL